MYASKPRLVEQARADVLEERAGLYWTEFYVLHANNFYKDRHWFEHEFGEHLVGKTTFLEAGCGTGSTIYPLLDITGPKSHVYACDFASTAVDLVRRHKQYSPERVTAFEADLTQSDALLGHVPPASVDAALMVFVLSAISPRKMRHALENVRHALKDDVGVVCLRDYAEGDLCESRMRGEGRQRLLEDGFYVRGDVGIGISMTAGGRRIRLGPIRARALTQCTTFGSPGHALLLFLHADAEPSVCKRRFFACRTDGGGRLGEERAESKDGCGTRPAVGIDLDRRALAFRRCGTPRRISHSRDALRSFARYVQGVWRKASASEIGVDGVGTAIRAESAEDSALDSYEERNTQPTDESYESYESVGYLRVTLPSVRAVDRFLAEDLCTSSESRSLSHTVELVTSRSSGILSVALLSTWGVRRVIACPVGGSRVMSRVQRLLNANSSRVLWERIRVGCPDDVDRAQLIVFEWPSDDGDVCGEDVLRIAADMARRTGARIATACTQDDLAGLLARCDGYGLEVSSSSHSRPLRTEGCWRIGLVPRMDR